jgi:hypothetical protein
VDLTQITAHSITGERETERTAFVEFLVEPHDPLPRLGEHVEWKVSVLDVDGTKSASFRGVVSSVGIAGFQTVKIEVSDVVNI